MFLNKKLSYPLNTKLNHNPKKSEISGLSLIFFTYRYPKAIEEIQAVHFYKRFCTGSSQFIIIRYFIY